MKKALVLVCLTGFLSACAGVNFYKDEALTQKTGLKYYSAKPYILVARAEAKGQPGAVSIVYLPDLAHPLYLKQTAGLGASDLKLTLSNGMLVSFGSTTDPAVAESLKALSSLLTGGAEVFGKLAGRFGLEEPEAGVFALYEILVEAGGTTLKRVEVRK